MLGVYPHVMMIAHHQVVLAGHGRNVHQVGGLRVGKMLRVGLRDVVHAQVRLRGRRGSALARHVEVLCDVARSAHERAGGAGLTADVELVVPVVIHSGASGRRWFLGLRTAGWRGVLAHQLAHVLQRRRTRGRDGRQEVGVALRWEVERGDLSTEHDKSEEDWSRTRSERKRERVRLLVLCVTEGEGRDGIEEREVEEK